MATRKHYHGRRGGGDGPVVFGRPTIGPRVYLVRGPSGWSETYDRKLADAALAKFLHPLAVAAVISPFLTKIRLEAREETWADCVEHLTKITQIDPKAIPEIVIVAFWAQAMLLEEEEEEGTN
jgi:hypothetical protein